MPLPRAREEDLSCLFQRKENAFQAPVVLLKVPSARAKGLWEREGQRAEELGQPPRCVALPAPWMGAPSLPARVVQGRSLLWGDPPGLCPWPSQQQVISITGLTVPSKHADWQPARFPRFGVFSFPFQKAKQTPAGLGTRHSCKSHRAATGETGRRHQEKCLLMLQKDVGISYCFPAFSIPTKIRGRAVESSREKPQN